MPTDVNAASTKTRYKHFLPLAASATEGLLERGDQMAKPMFWPDGDVFQRGVQTCPTALVPFLRGSRSNV